MRRALGSHGSAPAAAAPVQPAQMLRSHVMACSSISSRSSRSSSASGGVISRSWGLRTNPGEAAGLHTGTTSSSLLHSHASLPLHQLKSAAHGWPQSSYAMQHAQRGQVACSAAGAGRSYARARPQPEPWNIVVAVSAVAMLMCNVHRSTFTVLLGDLASHFKLNPMEMGQLQSAMLVGYLLGQVPAGIIADKAGGERVLLVGCALWSLSLAAVGMAGDVATVTAARVAFGLASACAMPAVSAMAARWVPSALKSATLASVYLMFNLGGVLGFAMVPLVCQKMAWFSAFITAGAGGVMCALMGWAALSRIKPPPAPAQPAAAGVATGPGPGQREDTAGSSSVQGSSTTTSRSSSSSGALVQAQDGSEAGLGKPTWTQLAALCFAHGVIGWGFFILQGWIPLYLKETGVSNLANAGLLSSLPWLAAGVTGTVAGSIADRLIARGMARLTVRRLMHVLSTVGCALAILPLALSDAASVTPAQATALLCLFNSFYAASFGGFHPYVQDVAKADAGTVIAYTNSTSIAFGILGNLCVGSFLQQGSWAPAFLVTALLYVSSCLVFLGVLDGRPIHLSRLRLKGGQ